jgi:predicted DNA-binding transcriptional regulator AlpA
MRQTDKEIVPMLLYPKEVRKLLGVGAGKFYEFIHLDNFPKPRMVGTVKTGMYLREELIEWVRSLPIDNKLIDTEEL